MLGVDRFGASAPGKTVLREYGFTVDNVCARAEALLAELEGDVFVIIGLDPPCVESENTAPLLGPAIMANRFKVGDHVR